MSPRWAGAASHLRGRILWRLSMGHASRRARPSPTWPATSGCRIDSLVIGRPNGPCRLDRRGRLRVHCQAAARSGLPHGRAQAHRSRFPPRRAGDRRRDLAPRRADRPHRPGIGQPVGLQRRKLHTLRHLARQHHPAKPVRGQGRPPFAPAHRRLRARPAGAKPRGPADPPGAAGDGPEAAQARVRIARAPRITSKARSRSTAALSPAPNSAT